MNVMYPKTSDSTFNMDYYLNNHLPMVGGLLKDITLGTELVKGIGSVAPGSDPAYMVVFSLYCESAEAFREAFATHAATIAADFQNYTNVEPVIQINEVLG